MLKFTPILLAILYALAMYRFSVWRTARELDARSTELADPRLKRMTDRLAASLDLARIPVYIYEIDPVNGLAAPDGRIFITRGFYRKFQSGEVSGEELSSVIAHELGHVALGHSRRRMIDFSGQNALRTALMMVLGRFIPFFGIWIANMLTTLLAAGLSRSDEYEADAYAAALLTRAGIGIEPQKSLFRKLDALTQQRAGMAPAWLMSHPKTQQRIEALEKLQARWQA
jgi:putative metalloprotease